MAALRGALVSPGSPMAMSGVHGKAESKVTTAVSPDPLDALLEASASLLSSPEVSSVVSRVLDLARRVIVADAYAVWHASQDNHWKVVASAGLPPELDTELVTSDSERRAIPREPYFVPDVFSDPTLTGRRELYRHHGIQSILVLPLVLKGETGGSVTFYFRENRTLSAAELKYATALANLASSALATAALYESQIAEQQRFSYLAELSSVLANSLDYQTTLQQVADMTVPRVADGCNVYMIEGKRLRSVAYSVADPAKRALAEQLSRELVEELHDDLGAGRLIKNGEPILFTSVPDEVLALFSHDPEHVKLLRKIGIVSAISVPLFARGNAIGVLRLITAESGRRFTQRDLELARDLGNRAAIAIDNARLHNELRNSEERYRFVTEALPIHVWFGERGSVEYSNQHLLQFTGLTVEQLQAGDALKLIHPLDLQRVIEASRESFSTGAPFRQEYRARNAGGSYRWLLAESRQFIDAQGRIKWLGTSIDITERKHAEEALLRSEKLAATGRLAATIAHEINNPLEAVTNLVYLAQHTPETPDEVRASLAEADRQLHHVAQIVRQTLGFYRENASARPTGVREMINGVVDLYLRKLAAKQLNLKISVPDDLQFTVVAGEIRQVLANLIANAIDAAPIGGEVEIFGSKGKGGVEISVLDNGPGIAVEFASQLFQPFFTTKKEVGTGLGLWVSRQIMEKHDGTLTYSHDNTTETTTFTIQVGDSNPTDKN
jgi:PAS domain S-box-containing protein